MTAAGRTLCSRASAFRAASGLVLAESVLFPLDIELIEWNRRRFFSRACFHRASSRCLICLSRSVACDRKRVACALRGGFQGAVT